MSTASTAYVVPKIMWDRMVKQLEEANKKHQQSGGGIGGMDTSGNVNLKDFLQTLAASQSITQPEGIEFVKKADGDLKRILTDPSLTANEKVRLLASYSTAEQDIRANANGKDDPAPGPQLPVGGGGGALVTPARPGGAGARRRIPYTTPGGKSRIPISTTPSTLPGSSGYVKGSSKATSGKGKGPSGSSAPTPPTTTPSGKLPVLRFVPNNQRTPQHKAILMDIKKADRKLGKISNTAKKNRTVQQNQDHQMLTRGKTALILAYNNI